MTQIYAPGEKTHRDENFPVASFLIARKYRGAVLTFYRFARAADDVADDPRLSPEEKIHALDQFEATLCGVDDAVAAALPLRRELKRRNLSPRHALDLLIAFRQDARKQRYRDWGDLMQYCAYSAAPVGRFVLDLHGESAAIWPASDGLCSALQIINHLQDCRADYERLNRVYIPQETFARHGIDESALAAQKASPALRACLSELAEKTQTLLSVPLSPLVRDLRLSTEVASIDRIAHRLISVLRKRDPLSERVHLSAVEFIAIIMAATIRTLIRRMAK